MKITKCVCKEYDIKDLIGHVFKFMDKGKATDYGILFQDRDNIRTYTLWCISSPYKGTNTLCGSFQEKYLEDLIKKGLIEYVGPREEVISIKDPI